MLYLSGSMNLILVGRYAVDGLVFARLRLYTLSYFESREWHQHCALTFKVFRFRWLLLMVESGRHVITASLAGLTAAEISPTIECPCPE